MSLRPNFVAPELQIACLLETSVVSQRLLASVYGSTKKQILRVPPPNSAPKMCGAEFAQNDTANFYREIRALGFGSASPRFHAGAQYAAAYRKQDNKKTTPRQPRSLKAGVPFR